MVRRSGLQRSMRWGREADSEPVLRFNERCRLISEVGNPLIALTKGAQPPPVQVMFFGAAPLHQGELALPLTPTSHLLSDFLIPTPLAS